MRLHIKTFHVNFSLYFFLVVFFNVVRSRTKLTMGGSKLTCTDRELRGPKNAQF